MPSTDHPTEGRTMLVLGAPLAAIPGDRDSVIIVRRGVVTEQRELLDYADLTDLDGMDGQR